MSEAFNMNFEGVIIQSITFSKINRQFLIRKEEGEKARGEKKLTTKNSTSRKTSLQKRERGYVKWNQLVTKGQILYDSTYIRYME